MHEILHLFAFNFICLYVDCVIQPSGTGVLIFLFILNLDAVIC